MALRGEPKRLYMRAYMRAYRMRDIEATKAAQRERDGRYRLRHPERVRASSKRYAEKTPGYRRAHRAADRAARLQRTPAWADLRAIRDFYAACPPGHHVDHIVPLRGRLVSGLHVQGNLAYLPRVANQRKSNHWP